jgi:hypothetical protein
MINNKMESKVSVNVDGEIKEVEIYVQKPSNEVLKMAERYKSKVWNQCIQDDILTKKELAVFMRKRGIWDEAKDREEEQITKDILMLERELYQGKTGKAKPKLSEGRDVAIQIRRKRFELRDLITERITLEENTADSLADNSRFDYLVASCSFYKNGTRVYKDFNEYNNKSADEIAYACAGLLGKMLYNLDSNFEKNLPENKFLTKFGLVNEDLSLVDPQNPSQLVDTKGKNIDDEGYYLDQDGHRIDREGNKINTDGTYEMVDYEDDLNVELTAEPETVKKPKTKTKKTTEKNTESEAESVV